MDVDTTIVDLIEAANTLYAQWPDARPNIHQEEDTPQNPGSAPNILKPVRSCDEGSSARHAVERRYASKPHPINLPISLGSLGIYVMVSLSYSR